MEGSIDMKSAAQFLEDIQPAVWITDNEIPAEYHARTDLGRKLIAIRRAYIENGGSLLDEHGVDVEIRARRGGVDG